MFLMTIHKSKKVFQLVVSIFKLLNDWTRQSHANEILILEILATKLYLMILNLDCEKLIIEKSLSDRNGRMFSQTWKRP